MGLLGTTTMRISADNYVLLSKLYQKWSWRNTYVLSLCNVKFPFLYCMLKWNYIDNFLVVLFACDSSVEVEYWNILLACFLLGVGLPHKLLINIKKKLYKINFSSSLLKHGDSWNQECDISISQFPDDKSWGWG